MESSTIRILIVDDHPVVRQGLSSFLRTVPGLVVVGEAGSGSEAVELTATLHPDVILLDFQMPGMDGVQTAVAIRARFEGVKIIMLSTFSEPEMVTESLRAGAVGYLTKNTPLEQIITTIRAAQLGRATLAGEAAAALVRGSVVPPPSVEFKPRELEVLTLMCKGLTNPQIAERLFLSQATVKYYVSEILSKLHMKSRTEAVAYAVEHGLIPRDTD
jgi:DNA-binding NarL/FixJ family response regulator